MAAQLMFAASNKPPFSLARAFEQKTLSHLRLVGVWALYTQWLHHLRHLPRQYCTCGRLGVLDDLLQENIVNRYTHTRAISGRWVICERMHAKRCYMGYTCLMQHPPAWAWPPPSHVRACSGSHGEQEAMAARSGGSSGHVPAVVQHTRSFSSSSAAGTGAVTCSWTGGHATQIIGDTCSTSRMFVLLQFADTIHIHVFPAASLLPFFLPTCLAACLPTQPTSLPVRLPACLPAFACLWRLHLLMSASLPASLPAPLPCLPPCLPPCPASLPPCPACLPACLPLMSVSAVCP